MKFHTTRRELREGYTNIIKAQKGELYNLLSHEKPVAYLTGKDDITGNTSWVADVYDCAGTAIVVGDKPFGNIKPKWDIVTDYEIRAGEILKDESLKYYEAKEKLHSLLEKFVMETIMKS